MNKLTSKQIGVLRMIAGAEDGTLPAADGSKSVVAQLTKRGLVTCIVQGDGANALTITTEGRAALGQPEPIDPTASSLSATGPQAKAPIGKIGTVVAMLREPNGATIEALMAATGWQAHSVRGAISGSIKKKLGLNVVSDKTEAGRVYRIAAEA